MRERGVEEQSTGKDAVQRVKPILIETKRKGSKEDKRTEKRKGDAQKTTEEG